MDKRETNMYRWVIIVLGIIFLVSLMALVHNSTKNASAPANTESKP